MTKKHKWTFPARFRSKAYGWKGTAPASKRLREAVTEIKKVNRTDQVLAAEGAVSLMGKLWPSLQHIDTSSGALGNAVHKTLEQLIPIIIEAPAPKKTRKKWLERLWESVEEDGVDYLYPVSQRWGEICGSPDLAQEWVDTFLPILQRTWSERGGYFRGTPACLSAMLATERYQELLELIDTAPFIWWTYREFGFKALAAQGKVDQALAYAEQSRGLNDPVCLIAQACEELLLNAGRAEEAYEQFALEANQARSYLATYRNIAKKYPNKPKEELLADLIATTPGEEGKWFATAKKLEMYDRAIELATHSPVEPKTLIRAVRDHLETQTTFAFKAGMLALYWLSEGWGYEITGYDVREAYNRTLEAATKLGVAEQAKDDIHKMLSEGDSFARTVLRL